MGIDSISFIIAAFVNGSLGVAALMRNFKSRLCVSFAFFAGVAFTHDALAVLGSLESRDFENPRLLVLSLLLMGPAILYVLYELLPAYQRWVRRVLFGYVPVIVAYVVFSQLSIYPSYHPWVFILATLALLLPAGIWLFALKFAEISAVLAREKLRFRFAFYGGVVALAFYSTNALHFIGISVPPLGTPARVLYLLFIFQTFIQKELLTVDEVVGRVFLFGGISLILSTIYFLLVSWVGGDETGMFFFNTFIASFVIIILFDPIRKLTGRFTHRFFLRKNAVLEAEINRLADDLRGVMEPVELSRKVATTLKRSLGVETGLLYVLDRDGLSFMRIDSSGSSVGLPEILISSPIVEYMQLKRGRPFVLENIENDRDSFYGYQPRRFCQDCQDVLRELGVDFIIPFMHTSKIVGFLAVNTGERIALSNEQLRLFVPLARQIAQLLSNSQQFLFLRERDKLAAVGEMAAGLAHEIKNPLGSIKGAAQLLQDDDSSVNREFLKIILDESERLNAVLTDFLAYAKPRKDHPVLSCNPLRVIEHTVALLRQNEDLKIEIESEQSPISVEWDPDVLKQVLLNLCINALQAMEGRAHRKLKISLKRIHSGRGGWSASSGPLPWYKAWQGWDLNRQGLEAEFVEITVRDTGLGIRPEALSKIFVPFYTTKPQGTGLGLAVCQRLIEDMGGSIHALSEWDKGTQMVLHLPVRKNYDQWVSSPQRKESLTLDGRIEC